MAFKTLRKKTEERALHAWQCSISGCCNVWGKMLRTEAYGTNEGLAREGCSNRKQG